MDLSLFEGPIKRLVESITGRFSEEVRFYANNHILEYQVKTLRRNLFSKTFIHRAAPKNLLDFYEPLSIIEASDENLRLYQLAKDRGELDYLRIIRSRISNSRFRFKRTLTNEVSELFLNKNCVLLIGNAGCGKSTLVKYLFVKCIQDEYKIPIKIELRYLSDYGGSLFDYIINEVFKFNNFTDELNVAKRLLEQDKFVFFFDGYDEISTKNREKITKDIDDFITLYPDNKYLLTSRPFTDLDLLPSFHNYYVSDLIGSEIDNFIHKQLGESNEELIEKILKSIRSNESRSFRSFLSNPLLLSMYILSFQNYADIPDKKSIFYRQVFDALFSLHDSMSKLAFVREKQSGISKEQFEFILRIFCFVSFFEEKFIFSVEYLHLKFNQIKSIKKTIQFENDLLISDLKIAIGIINKEGLDYVFPHRSLQEYFAASYIANLKQDQKSVVYGKMYSTMFVKGGDIYENENFISLLLEQDLFDITRFLFIPMLEAVISLVEEIRAKDIETKIQYYKSLGLIIQTVQAYSAYTDWEIPIITKSKKRTAALVSGYFFINRHRYQAGDASAVIDDLENFVKRRKRNVLAHNSQLINSKSKQDKVVKYEDGLDYLSAMINRLQSYKSEIVELTSFFKERLAEDQDSTINIIELI